MEENVEESTTEEIINPVAWSRSCRDCGVPFVVDELSITICPDCSEDVVWCTLTLLGSGDKRPAFPFCTDRPNLIISP